MIDSVQFRNFKVLRDTKLPLSPFTLIIGPNASGKSTALQGIQAVPTTVVQHRADLERFVTAALRSKEAVNVEVSLIWGPPYEGLATTAYWSAVEWRPLSHKRLTGKGVTDDEKQSLNNMLARIRVYSLSASSIAAPTRLEPKIELRDDGGFLAGVLDRLRDLEPERFEALNEEVSRWLPEFDQILFDTPSTGVRAILLRTREGHHKIQATDLSQGTLLALAILTLAYLPNPPAIVCFEEPDRGIHPRLLRDVRDALYRLSYPGSFGEKRKPVQVVATTHSPYFLDLFKDHPEEIVIAKRDGLEARFERLSDLPDLQELLVDAHLGDVWYSGVLGGVPPER